MSHVTNKNIGAVKQKVHDEEVNLRRLARESNRMRKHRQEYRQKIDDFCSENPAAANDLRSFNRDVTGRPRLEVDQSELLSTIVRIVKASSAADDRRRSECLRSVKTLNDLHGELVKLNFKLSRSATYLRLLPRRGESREGKRHVQTVKVKLLRPENSLRKKNVDRMYAKSFIDDLTDVCELFGPGPVLVMSNDEGTS